MKRIMLEMKQKTSALIVNSRKLSVTLHGFIVAKSLRPST